MFYSLLTSSGSTAHLGALTDSKLWKFIYLVDERWFQTDIVTDSDEHIEIVLGIQQCIGLLLIFRDPNHVCCRKIPNFGPAGTDLDLMTSQLRRTNH